MDWLSGIQNVIDYIEEHITDEIDTNVAAREAACSGFYLQKLFSIIFGMTIGDYIRCRRLTLAGNELCISSEKIIDIALRYGYESPESFSRAFSKFHGITPSEARRDGSKLRFFPRLFVKVTLGKGELMGYKIVEKPAFDIIEKTEPQPSDDEKSQKTIQEFWKRSLSDGTSGILFDISTMPGKCLGICYGNLSKGEDTFNYSVAAICEKDAVPPKGFKKSTIPARTWAIFECTGPVPETMQESWQAIVSEFFPSSGYRPTYEMDIEVYSSGDRRASDYKSEIWVPIKKK